MKAETPLSFGQHVRSLTTPAFHLLETRHSQGMALPVHEHARACVNFVLEGCYREALGPDEHEFAPLACFYKPAGAPHSNRFPHAPARTLLVELAREDLLAPGTELREPATAHAPGAARAALAMWHELAAPDACSALVLEQLGVELYEDTLSEAHHVRERSERVCAARDTLHDDPRQPWTLSSLAERVGLHPSHLARAFRQRHGCTIGEYLRRLRLNQIALALALGERAISDLVLEQGFADQSHGTRAFRRQFGTTPAAFRRAFRGWSRARSAQAGF